MVKLRIITQHPPATGVQILDASTGEDLGSCLGIQKVWYKARDDGAICVSFDLDPEIEIEQVQMIGHLGFKLGALLGAHCREIAMEAVVD